MPPGGIKSFLYDLFYNIVSPAAKSTPCFTPCYSVVLNSSSSNAQDSELSVFHIHPCTTPRRGFNILYPMLD